MELYIEVTTILDLQLEIYLPAESSYMKPKVVSATYPEQKGPPRIGMSAPTPPVRRVTRQTRMDATCVVLTIRSVKMIMLTGLCVTLSRSVTLSIAYLAQAKTMRNTVRGKASPMRAEKERSNKKKGLDTKSMTSLLPLLLSVTKYTNLPAILVTWTKSP